MTNINFTATKNKIIQHYLNGLDSNERPTPIDLFYDDANKVTNWIELTEFFVDLGFTRQEASKYIYNAWISSCKHIFAITS